MRSFSNSGAKFGPRGLTAKMHQVASDQSYINCNTWSRILAIFEASRIHTTIGRILPAATTMSSISRSFKAMFHLLPNTTPTADSYATAPCHDENTPTNTETPPSTPTIIRADTTSSAHSYNALSVGRHRASSVYPGFVIKVPVAPGVSA
jgi:hypothetical protein